MAREGKAESLIISSLFCLYKKQRLTTICRFTGRHVPGYFLNGTSIFLEIAFDFLAMAHHRVTAGQRQVKSSSICAHNRNSIETSYLINAWWT